MRKVRWLIWNKFFDKSFIYDYLADTRPNEQRNSIGQVQPAPTTAAAVSEIHWFENNLFK